MLVAALVVAALVPLVSCVPCATTCTTDLDCSLNGACSGGACTCDPGWTGQCCGVLDLLPVDVNATHLGYRHPDTSTWGGVREKRRGRV